MKMDKKTRNNPGKYKTSGRNDLITLLQEIQAEKGFISEESIKALGELLGISTTKIYGVASFYDGFRFSPGGRVYIRLCKGTACYVNRTFNIAELISEELKIKPGETSPDGKLSIEMVDCMGACHLGPLIAVNERYYTIGSERELRQILGRIKKDEQSVV
ncbi:MAG: NAD(P)H-dependent oxidoreductase subunit E [Bacteroidales bacterium]|nr:NAD(P)H-dependent oxidoreductase subunit E [Bacteroidales bacterium]